MGCGVCIVPVRQIAVAIAAIISVALASPAATAAERVDLELALAADISGSMSPAEAELQRQGYIDALTDPLFLAAVSHGRLGRIAVAYIEWAGTGQQWLTVPWSTIDGEASARNFIARIGPARQVHWEGTSISAAIGFAATSILSNEFDGETLTIDISGDGPNNTGPSLALARTHAVAQGIAINGLPIIGRDAEQFAGIDAYYADCVIAGPGSFSLPAQGLSEFAAAIRQKLILEVAGRKPGGVEQVRPAAATDCEAAERLRRQYLDRYFPDL